MRNPYVVNALRMGAKSGAVFSIIYSIITLTSILLGKGYFKNGLPWFTIEPKLLSNAIAGISGVFLSAIIGFLIGMLISLPYTAWWLNKIMKKHQR